MATVTLAQSVKDATKRRAKFRAAKKRGLNYEEIGAKFGVTRQRAYQIINHKDGPVGKPGRKPSEEKAERDEKMRALFRQGVSQAELAERFELSRKTVSAIVGRKNGRRGPLPGTPRPPRAVVSAPETANGPVTSNEARSELGLDALDGGAELLTDWP